LDRYVKIQGVRVACCHRWLRGSKWSVTVCGFLWVASLVAVVPMIALAEGNEEQGKCFQYKARTRAPGKAYFNLLLVAVFWLVFVLLVVSYGRIACRLLRASRDKPDLPNATRYSRTALKKSPLVVLFLFTVPALCPTNTHSEVFLHPVPAQRGILRDTTHRGQNQ
ncbi:hypothetical protein NFI96_005604, partial [Prochilodus magdalenae]